MRAFTPQNEGGVRAGGPSKNKPHEVRHAVQVYSKRSGGQSRGVKSKNSDIMSANNDTPLRQPTSQPTSPKNEIENKN